MIFGELFQHDTVLGDVFDKLVGPRADGSIGEVLTEGFAGLGADDHARAVGQGCQQRHRRFAQIDLDGIGINDFDAGNAADFRLATRGLHGQRAIKVVLDRCRIDLFAVVEGGVFADLEGQHGAVVVPLPAGGDHGDDLTLLVDIHDLVAQRLQHVATHKAPIGGRIKRVGIVLQADIEH